jgi:spermidine synthase
MSRRGEAARFVTDSGVLTLRRDPDGAAAWFVDLDGHRQSHVDLEDPTRLVFGYMRRIGHVVDLVAPAGEPLDVVHLGGGGLTMARYIAVTRPGSRQRVFETDVALTRRIRAALPLPRGGQVRVGARDALVGLQSLPDRSAELVVMDVYAHGRIPPHLSDMAVPREVTRVLRRGGTYAINIVDEPPLTLARRQVATIQGCWPHVAAIMESSTLTRRHRGNVVVVASDAPLPAVALAARTAADPLPARTVNGTALLRFRGGARPLAAPPPAAHQPSGSPDGRRGSDPG